MKCEAIIFDLDDTLYPERDYVLSGFRAAADWAQAHLDIPAEEGLAFLRAGFFAGVRGNAFDQWLAACGRPLWAVPELIRVYREHRPILQAFCGIPELLRELKQRFRLGLLSDGHLPVQQNKLAALGLEPYFDAVVFSDELGREAWKPNERPFQAILRRLDVAPSSAVYVGDNPIKDFVAARSLGMYTVWSRHSGGDYARQEPPSAAHRAHATVDSVPGLRGLLLSLDALDRSERDGLGCQTSGPPLSEIPARA